MTDRRVPAEWLSLKFTEILDIQGGTQPPKSQFVDEAREGYVRLLQIRDFGKKPVPTFIPDTSKLKKCNEGDLLIGRYGASLGRICTGMEGAYNVALAKVITPTSLYRGFLKGYLESEHFQGALRLLSRSAQNGFNKGDLETFDFLLPPLAEQKVIADKLDTLLAQVENTKARLERIPQILKRFRQSVLAAAVSGRLTDDEEASDGSWPPTKLANLCTTAFDGPFGSKLKSSDYTDGGVGVVRLENIRHLRFDRSKETFISEDKYLTLIKNKLEKNDILFSSFVDEEVRACLFPFETLRFINKADCFCLRIDQKKALPEFVLYLLTSQVSYAQIKEHVQGVTRPRVNLRILKSLEFPMPPLQVQAEVVRKVDQLFAHADRIEQQVNNALACVNNLPQSVLAKAFRGELTEQWRKDHPELISGEKSAESLLTRIKTEPEISDKQPRASAIKKKPGNSMTEKITVVEALSRAGKPLSGQQLLAAAGYPSDSNTEDLERFFLDLRDATFVEKTVVTLDRTDDDQDWFALTEKDDQSAWKG